MNPKNVKNKRQQLHKSLLIQLHTVECVTRLKDITKQGVYVDVKDMIEFAKDGIVSKTILKVADKEVSLFCMSTGQALSSHTSSFPAIIHELQGKGEVTLANKKYEAEPNAWFYMPANLSHAIQATQDLVFLLTLFKGTKQ